MAESEERSKDESEDTIESLELKKETTSLQLMQTQTDKFKAQFELAKTQIEIAKEFVEIVMNSSYRSKFEDLVDGKRVVNPSDIVSCILLGFELGLQPISSLNYGRALNGNAYISIKRGRTLGLDDTAAMQNIHVWTKGDKIVVYTGIHIVNKVLIEAGVVVNILEDAIPIYKYKNASSGETFETLPEKSILISNDINVEFLKKKLAEGYIPITRTLFDKRTTVKLTRRNTGQEVQITYTLRQAINARLYKGVTDDGEKVDGKDNWNNHPETHLRNRTLMIAGRIIAADKLNNIYNEDEAREIIDLNTNDYSVK